jgi:hypothetical protein
VTAKNRVFSACLVSFAAAAAMVLVAQPAAAIPTDCTIFGGSTPTTKFNSLCTGGTGEHRIRVVVQHFNPAIGRIVCEGPWVSVGAVSSTGCPPHTLIEQSVDKR